MPHAVMTITGSVSSSAVNAVEQVEAFLARRGVAGVVQVDEHDVEVALLRAP